MNFNLLPKEYEFFDMFDTLATHIIDTSVKLKEITHKGSITEQDVQYIRDIEHAADALVHDITDKLNKTFITPYDREDIHNLAHEVDSVIDILLKLSNMIMIYKVTEFDQNFIEVVKLIDSSVIALTSALKGMRNMKDPETVVNYCIEVNRLEDEGDKLRNVIIAKLFGNDFDAIYIMKWKDIFQNAEKVLDQCERVAKIVESILVKQA